LGAELLRPFWHAQDYRQDMQTAKKRAIALMVRASFDACFLLCLALLSA
jgi:hypothetical protein